MTVKRKINDTNTTHKELSIQVSLSGLSFCIRDTQSGKITELEHFDFEDISTLDSLLVQLDYYLASNKLEKDGFDRVSIVHENELSTFVPKPLFQEENLADYLKFTIKILENDFITFDEIPNTDLVNVYVPYAHVNNFIFDHFGAFEYRHFATVLVEALMHKAPKTSEPIMFVNVQSRHFEIVVLKNRKLLLYNTFEYVSKEDFLYYVLFTAEQLEMNPERFQLYFLGFADKDSELFEMAYKYIRNVDIFRYIPTYEVEDSISNDTLFKQFILLNSF